MNHILQCYVINIIIINYIIINYLNNYCSLLHLALLGNIYIH